MLAHRFIAINVTIKQITTQFKSIVGPPKSTSEQKKLVTTQLEIRVKITICLILIIAISELI